MQMVIHTVKSHLYSVQWQRARKTQTTDAFRAHPRWCPHSSRPAPGSPFAKWRDGQAIATPKLRRCRPTAASYEASTPQAVQLDGRVETKWIVRVREMSYW